MASKINATTNNGLIVESDDSGQFELQSNGTTIATVANNAFTLASGASIVGNVTADQLTGTLPNSVLPDPLPGVPETSSLQCVSTVYTGKTTYSVATAGQTGTYIAVLDTTITPTKTSSKVRVEFNMSFEVHHDTILRLYKVVGGTTTEVRRNNDGNYWSGFAYPGYDVDNNSTPRTNHYVYIDSPNTTSAITYRLMIQSGGVGAQTFYLNRTVGSTGAQNHENAISQCILTEIPV